MSNVILASAPSVVIARDNPFAVHRVLRVRYRLQDTTWFALHARLEELQFQAAIVGPEGSGKTTLLEDLQQRFEWESWPTKMIRLRRGQRNCRDTAIQALLNRLSPADIVLVDGAEQLSSLAWWMLRRRARHCRGLVITSHRPDLLPTLIQCHTSPQLFMEILQSLLGDAAAAALQSETRLLFQKHGGNLRDGLRELYDLAARGALGSDMMRPGQVIAPAEERGVES